MGSFSNQHLGVQGTKALIEHWNGSAWSVVTSPIASLGDSMLNGATALSPTNAWAVGNTFTESNSNLRQPLIEHWNGALWTVVANPTFAHGALLNAVTALSGANVWAVGFSIHPRQPPLNQSLIEHWDGKTWKEVANPNPGSEFDVLTGLAAVSTNDVWAVGTFLDENSSTAVDKGLIERWNGTFWTVMQTPDPGVQGNFLSAIAADSPNDVWVIGNIVNDNAMSETLIEHWNGKVWGTVEGKNPGQASNTLSAVVARSTHDVWAVGSSSNAVSSSAYPSQQAQPFIEHWNGTAWKTVASPNIGTNDTTLNGAVLVLHSTSIWAVGTGATYGTPINIASPNATVGSNVTSVTAQTLIESCCS